MTIPSMRRKETLSTGKNNLSWLQRVVDIEDITGGVSIMDFGLNEFRIDLLNFIRENPDFERTPFGMHAVVRGYGDDYPPGAIFILKNIHTEVNTNNSDLLHPFYIVYVNEDGDTFFNHLSPKKTLDMIRYICKDAMEPDKLLCRDFNRETQDGRKMGKYSVLLERAITSIIDATDASDVDSLFKSGGTSALQSRISGMDDFELICFLVVK